jgi:hypothetical protein
MYAVLAGRDPGHCFSAFRTVGEVFSNRFQWFCRDASFNEGRHVLARDVLGLLFVCAFLRATLCFGQCE